MIHRCLDVCDCMCIDEDTSIDADVSKDYKYRWMGGRVMDKFALHTEMEESLKGRWCVVG